MKESKFIELLNLYVDRQISPEDAALLEAEILQNPRRRQTYSQYCRMHRACTLALDRYQAAGEAGRAEAKVVAFEGPRRARWGYYVAGLAAACVALVAVHSVFGPGKTSTTPFARAVRSQPATMRSEAQVLLTSVHLDAPTLGHCRKPRVTLPSSCVSFPRCFCRRTEGRSPPPTARTGAACRCRRRNFS